MNIMNIISNIVNNPKNIIGLIFFVILMVYHYVFDNFLLRESFINELSFVGSNNSNIRHLNSIQNSNIIKGDLSIINTDFKDLSFLKTITEIQGNLDIYENMDLTSLKGLSNLKKVGGYVSIISNGNKTLEGLESLETIGGYLTINNNEILENLDGLINLKSIGDSLMIRNNFKLKSINGIRNVEEVKGEFINICYNNNLIYIPKFIDRLSKDRVNINNIQKSEFNCLYRPTYRYFIRPLNSDVYKNV